MWRRTRGKVRVWVIFCSVLWWCVFVCFPQAYLFRTADYNAVFKSKRCSCCKQVGVFVTSSLLRAGRGCCGRAASGLKALCWRGLCTAPTQRTQRGCSRTRLRGSVRVGEMPVQKRALSGGWAIASFTLTYSDLKSAAWACVHSAGGLSLLNFSFVTTFLSSLWTLKLQQIMWQKCKLRFLMMYSA